MAVAHNSVGRKSLKSVKSKRWREKDEIYCDWSADWDCEHFVIKDLVAIVPYNICFRRPKEGPHPSSISFFSQRVSECHRETETCYARKAMIKRGMYKKWLKSKNKRKRREINANVTQHNCSFPHVVIKTNHGRKKNQKKRNWLVFIRSLHICHWLMM